MMTDTLTKFGAFLLLFAALFYLTIIGRMPSEVFQNLAIAAISGLGFYHAGKSGGGVVPDVGGGKTPPPPKQGG